MVVISIAFIKTKFDLIIAFLDFVCSDDVADLPNKKFLPSVSTSLAMATAFGIAETIALYFGSGFLLNTMGIPVVRDKLPKHPSNTMCLAH